MLEEDARNKIIEFLKNNNLYAVRWDSHFDRYFVCLRLSEKTDKTNEIYGAIYESYDYLVNDDEQVVKISIGYDCNSWNEVLEKMNKLPIELN